MPACNVDNIFPLTPKKTKICDTLCVPIQVQIGILEFKIKIFDSNYQYLFKAYNVHNNKQHKSVCFV